MKSKVDEKQSLQSSVRTGLPPTHILFQRKIKLCVKLGYNCGFAIYQRKHHKKSNSKEKPQNIMPLICILISLKYYIPKHNTDIEAACKCMEFKF